MKNEVMPVNAGELAQAVLNGDLPEEALYGSKLTYEMSEITDNDKESEDGGSKVDKVF